MPFESSPPSGDITLVFTDIEGSSRAASQNESAFLEALARHNSLIGRLVSEWDGFVVKNLGDGYFLAFPSLRTAAECMIAVQRELQTSEDFTTTGGLRVRIGLHCATLTPQAGDYFGAEVNFAQRVSDAGHGDMILLSAAAAERLKTEPVEDTWIESLGLHRLKNLSEMYPLYRLMHPTLLDRDFPPLRTLTTLQHNFPAQLTAFVGREHEVTELKRLITVENRRLVTLTGMGGVGKSRIAMQAALDTLENFPDGMWRVEFAEVHDAHNVPDAVAAALHESLTLTPDTETAPQIVAFFREKRALLLLENFERVIDAAAFISELTQSCPHLSVLVTSQQFLQLSGEREMTIEPMPLPAAKEPFDTLLRYDSARLFVERAANARANFTLTRENAPAIATLCRELEGLPLSLELTAALVRALTPQQLVQQLSKRFRLIAATRPDLEPRLRSLRGAIDWSYDLLTEEERKLYAELGVFVGGFTLEEVESVCDAPDALFSLIALRDKSLLKAEDTNDTTRYLMLTTLREYALEKLAGTDRLKELRQRHAEYFLQRAEQLDEEMSQYTQPAMAAFAFEAENMNAGLKFFEEMGDRAKAARYGNSLGRYYIRRGPYAIAERLLKMAETYERPLYETEPDTHRRILAQILLRRGNLYLRRGDPEQVERCMNECLPMFERVGDMRSALATRINLGAAVYSLDRLYDAKAHYEAALALAQNTNSNFTGTIFMDLALLETKRGDYPKAREYADKASKWRQDDLEDIAYTALNRGELCLTELESMKPEELKRADALFAEAQTALETALQLGEQLGNRQGIDRAQVTLGGLALLRGELGAAKEWLETAYAAAEENDDRECLFECMKWMGKLARLQKQGLSTIAHDWRRALDMAVTMKSAYWQCQLLYHIGEVCEEEGDRTNANRAFAITRRDHDALQMLPPKRLPDPPDFPTPDETAAEAVSDILAQWTNTK